MDVRLLGQEDEAVYRALWLHAMTSHSEFFRTSPNDDLPRGIPTRFCQDSFTLGAFLDQALVGIVSFERDPREKTRHKGLVFRMFVHPDSAGHGVGRELIQSLVSLTQGLGDLRYLHLTVLASNTRAISLYSSMQFVEFAREQGAVLIGDTYVDELQMARSLVVT
ncbi:MAG: GNAT family N-acetyltransferase [Arenimonas sp.]|nr:GNAT family N-acetyltransferase [Arenimonas sp.]